MKDHIIQGSPTKSFFIEMITRDIAIKDVIIHLLDNSIDGANRINPTNYEGLWVKITINKEEFIVQDNCGGFSLETAQKYAFRFGRPDDAPETKGSVGRFGIGMKRSLFKMGKNFEVESKTDTDHFEVKVDVAEWKSKKKTIKIEEDTEVTVEDWDFRYAIITEETSNLSDRGTYIKVTNLYEEVADLFDEPNFLNNLEEEIEKLLNFSLEKNITISLNEKPLKSKNITIFSEQSKPYFYQGEKDGVVFRVIAGLGDVGKPEKSGWYVYCNDRLVLESDRTDLTGWGVQGTPKWHVDYVMFRGIVFLDSIETIKLPLTTTKKGIDATSETYKVVLVFMKEAMKHVISFLKEITKLENEANDYRKLLGEQENKVSVVEMKTSVVNDRDRTFTAPQLNAEDIAKKKDSVRIAYNVKKAIADKAMDRSGTKNTKELGEYTFNYYLQMEELEK